MTHIHRYSKWQDAEYTKYLRGQVYIVTLQEKRCRKCNKLKTRYV